MFTWSPGKPDGLHHGGKAVVEVQLDLLPGPQVGALVLVPVVGYEH